MQALLVLLLVLLPAVASALSLAEILAEGTRNVVVIRAYAEAGGPARTGSGIVVRPGLIMTNCGLVDGVRLFTVQFQGTLAVATPGEADPARDLCMIKTIGVAPFDHGVSDGMRLQDVRGGQVVFAIGAPGGQNLTIVRGVIIDGWPKADGTILLRTDAPISPGALGGGLFDENGRMIGITMLQLTDNQALAMAVPWAPMPDQAQGVEWMKRYALTFAREISKDQRFPREAMMQGWVGTTEIKVIVGADGQIKDVSVAKSSGHQILDDEAVGKIMRAPHLPQLPETLLGQEFTIVVPITFRLE